MFSLSGTTPAIHTPYESASRKATGLSFIMARLHCVHVHAHITMGQNYAWPSLISCHLSHGFGRAPQPSDPNFHLSCHCRVGVRSDEVWTVTEPFKKKKKKKNQLHVWHFASFLKNLHPQRFFFCMYADLDLWPSCYSCLKWCHGIKSSAPIKNSHCGSM